MAFDLRKLLSLVSQQPQAQAAPAPVQRYEDGSAQVGQVATPAAIGGTGQPLAVQGHNPFAINLGVGNASPQNQPGFNPGFTPLQNSGFGSAGQPQFQPYDAGEGIQARGHKNPQLRDNGYLWQ